MTNALEVYAQCTTRKIYQLNDAKKIKLSWKIPREVFVPVYLLPIKIFGLLLYVMEGRSRKLIYGLVNQTQC